MARKAFIERAVGKPSYVYRMGLDFTHLLFRLSRLAVLGKRHPWIREDKTDIRFLPINQDIDRPGDSPMPLQLLDRLIELALERHEIKSELTTSFEVGSQEQDTADMLESG